MEVQQAFRLARIASQEGCRALLAMTVKPFRLGKESKTTEDTMDSRLRGNDSSHRE
jgi:hypothetical protein